MFEKIRLFGSKLKTWLWLTELTDLPAWRVRAVKAARIVFAVLRDFMEGQITLRAMSLVYTTLLSLVPLLAVSFSVLKGFGVHNQLEPLLLNFLAPLGDQGVEITRNIIGFVDRIKVGLLGTASLAFLVYTVISLMQKIESSFNYIWRVPTTRPLHQRFSDYLSVLLIGPVLVFSALGLTGTMMNYSAVQWLTGVSYVGAAIKLLTGLVPYLMVIGAFTFIYIFMPNTRVKFSAALIGATVAGVLWETTGYLFASLVVFSSYTAIYSAFASLVFFLLWLHLGWLILLIGASIAFYVQNPDYILTPRREPRLSNHTRERIALLAMAQIARRFYHGQPPASLKDLAILLHTPSGLLQQVLNALEGSGLVRQTNDRQALYLPARPLEDMGVKEVLDAVRHAEETIYINSNRLVNDAQVDRIFSAMDESLEAALHDQRVKDFAVAAGDETRSK